jgi:PAS domain-containing protein
MNHFVSELIQALAAPWLAMANMLSPLLSNAADRPGVESDHTVAAFAVSVAVMGILCCWWTAWTHARLRAFQRHYRRETGRLEAILRFRGRLLAAGRHRILVMGDGLDSPISFGGASQLLAQCMKGPDARRLAEVLDELLRDGQTFELDVQIDGMKSIAVRGQPIGRRAVLFFEDARIEAQQLDFQAILEALRIPIWIRNRDLSLRWANAAFLKLTQSTTVEMAQRLQASIDRSERDLAHSAQDGDQVINARRYTMVGGERRAIALNLDGIGEGLIVGHAVDVTDTMRAENEVRTRAEGYADLLNRIPVAIAGFDKGRRLQRYNSAYQQLWCLEATWLDTHPSIDDILDRLRNAGRLPEQRNFVAWKQQHLQTFDDSTRYVDEAWHLPGGKSLHVQAQPDLDGGVCYLFEDRTDVMKAQSKLNLLLEVQRAMLDNVEDAMLLFGPDGKLALCNSAFLKLWHLTDEQVAASPHFTEMAALCADTVGRDGCWDIVAAGVMSPDPESYAAWGKVTRCDGKIVSLAFARLANGATSVTFKDLTDIERFSEFLAGEGSAAA